MKKFLVLLAFFALASATEASALTPWGDVAYEGTSAHLSILKAEKTPTGTLYAVLCASTDDADGVEYFFVDSGTDFPINACGIDPEEDYQYFCDNETIYPHLSHGTRFGACSESIVPYEAITDGALYFDHLEHWKLDSECTPEHGCQYPE